MWKNHLKIALRGLSKNKLFSALNIFGLATGLTVACLLLLYIQDELSFDKMHQNLDQIHRVVVNVTRGGESERWGSAPNAVGPTALENIAGVKSQVRLIKHNFGDKAFINTEGKKLVESNFYLADSTLFDIFDIDLVRGNPEGLLGNPSDILLSESAAQKYFDDRDPMGQTITINQKIQMKVAGIYKDFSTNMTLDADMLGSFYSQKWMQRQTWSNSSFETFLLLESGTDPKHVEAKLAELLDQNVEKEGQWYTLELQPLRDVHLQSSDISNTYTSRLGNPAQVRLLIYLAMVVLLIACINYMNLATARSQHRSKEVGINKTIGANRSHMIQRFYTETTLLVGCAFVVSLILLTLSLPVFNSLSGKAFNWQHLAQPTFAIGSLGLVGALILISGLYPALYLSAFSPSALFNQAFKGSKGKDGVFRKGLVVAQFIASVVIIVATLVFYEQLRYVQQKELGHQPNLVVGVNLNGLENKAQEDGLVNSLKRLPEVNEVAKAQTFPGSQGSGRNLAHPQHADQTIMLESNHVSGEILDVLELKLLAGKTLPDRIVTYEDSIVQVVLNEKAIAFLGYTPEEAIGKDATGLFYGKFSEIVGVVENFHFESFYQPIGAYAFHNNPSEYANYAIAKLSSNDVGGSLQKIKQSFESIAPNSAFEYTFLDQHLEQLYRAEQRSARIFLIFSMLTILVACLGLFGLTAYSAERRTKEIGVRKVLGASIGSIVRLLSIDFLKLVLIAFMIAVPLAWYLMDQWLANFAYHTPLHWWVFLFAGLGALCIAFLTVSVQSIKAAVVNPVESLKSE